MLVIWITDILPTVIFDNGAVSKKQTIVTLSTGEAEYVALSTAVQEAVWLRKLLKDFGALQDQSTVIMEDNQGVICIARNPIVYSITKHIDVHYHYIRQSICEDLVELQYFTVIADLLTKILPRGKFEMF